jgi:sensor histidine kinase YesM
MEADRAGSQGGQVWAAVRGLVWWLVGNSLAGGLVGVAIALFSQEAGAFARFVPTGILFANAIGFAAGFSARFVLPRYSELPSLLRFPLAVLTLLAGGAFGTALVILWNPLAVLYQGRLLFLLVVVDSIIAVIVGLIIYNYERLRDQIETSYAALARNRVREERLRELAARSELKALKAQINPHFLFNALNSISALISHDPDAAQETLERLAGIFRGTLLASEKGAVPFRKEMELVDAYLDVERARFGKRLRVEEDIEPEARDIPVPPLILQPVVENAVRHGISPTVDGGTLSIEARIADGALHIVVTDDGKGTGLIDLEQMLAEGYGLRNVRDRLTTRFGEGDWFGFESSKDRGTRVTLVLPLERVDEGAAAALGPEGNPPARNGPEAGGATGADPGDIGGPEDR